MDGRYWIGATTALMMPPFAIYGDRPAPFRETTSDKLDRMIAETLGPEHVSPSGVSLLDLLPSGNLGL